VSQTATPLPHEAVRVGAWNAPTLMRHICWSMWTAALLLTLTWVVAAQAAPLPPAGVPQPQSATSTDTHAEAYIQYLLGLQLAEDGSKPEALKRFAASLRLQAEDNPAASLAFELLTEQRANSRLLLAGHTDAILSAVYSPDGSRIATTSADGTARVWDARTGAPLTSPLSHETSVLTSAFSPDGERLLTGSEDTVRLWSVSTGKPITEPLELHGSVQAVAFSPDGRVLAAGTDDGKLRTWDASTGDTLSPVIIYHEAVYDLQFNRDGSELLVAVGDGFADRLAPRTGKRIGSPMRHPNIVFTAVYSPDGATILTASADHTAILWDANTGAPSGITFQHGASVETAAFSDDGLRVLTASRDHTARVWDAKTGTPLTPVLQHSEAILKAVFSPDGRFVATAGRDRTVKLWDSTTGALLRLPVRSPGGSAGLVFAPHAASLLVLEGDFAEILDLPPTQPSPNWLVSLAQFAAVQTRYNQSEQPDLAEAHKLHTELMTSQATDPWTRFGKWYFADSATRPVSPWSTLLLQQYVDELIRRGDPASLELAREFSRDQPAWGLRIKPLLANVHRKPGTR
jgi:WD40 repeat protein